MASDLLKTKRTDLQKLINESKSLYAEMSKDPAKVTQEDRNKLDKLIADGKTLRAEVTRLEDLEDLGSYQEPENPSNAATPQAKGIDRNADTPKTPDKQKSLVAYPKATKWSELVIDSPQFKMNDRLKMEPVEVRALYNLTDNAGGYLTVNDRQLDMIDIARQRPFTVLDIINQSQTTSDAVEYVTIATRSNNAAPVVEYDTGTSQFGLKPESNLTFGLATAPVKTIATWIPASRQILQDAPRLRSMIDQELTYMVMQTLEDQIINGNGSSINFTGILNTAGIQARVKDGTTPSGRGQTTTDTIGDTLRRAITDIYLEYYTPDAIAMAPADVEKLELEKDTQGRYLNLFDPITLRVWRVPVVVTTVLPAGTAIVGAFKLGATLWDRLQTEIRISESHSDFFVRNAVVILADLRAAFAVVRPKSFEKVTGL